MKFGLVTEGPTDQIVIRHLLSAYFSDPDLEINPVQPNIDSTDGEDKLGGWTRVLNYCRSEDMLSTLEENDYVIIQIDTDICEELGVAKTINGSPVTEKEIIDGVKNVIVEKIGQGIFDDYSNKIIFAISHSSIECWLLGIYFSNNDKFKTDNCCVKLNQKLRTKGFTIDCDNKPPKIYYKICKNVKRKKDVLNLSAFNVSLKFFVEQLEQIQIDNNEAMEVILE